jgi:hypothetical protein
MMLDAQDKRAEGSLAERLSMLVFVFGAVMLALTLVVLYCRLAHHGQPNAIRQIDVTDREVKGQASRRHVAPDLNRPDLSETGLFLRVQDARD